MATFGYARVSGIDQNEDRQMIAMSEQGIPSERVFTDKQFGKDFERRRLYRCRGAIYRALCLYQDQEMCRSVIIGRDKSRTYTVFMNMFLSRNPGHRPFQPQKQALISESGIKNLRFSDSFFISIPSYT